MRSLFRLSAFVLFVLSVACPASAQDDGPKPEFFFKDGRKTIELKFTKSLSRDFIDKYAHMSGTYKLYEVESPDPDKPCIYTGCINEWTDFLDPAAAPACSDEVGCPKLSLRLKNALPADKKFILVVAGLKADGKPEKLAFSGEPKAEIVSALDAYNLRKGFRVKANVPLTSAADIKISRTVYKVTGDSPKTLKAVEEKSEYTAEVEASPDGTGGELSYRLKKNLPEGAEYSVSASDGLKDDLMKKVEAKGTLKTPGATAAPDAPKITGTFGLTSAAGQKSVLELSGTFTPLRKTSFLIFYWEPSLVVDLGLRSTKSNNSVTLSSPLTKNFAVQDTEEVCPESKKQQPTLLGPDAADQKPRTPCTNVVAYASWKNTPWYYLGSVKLYFGPKAEFDRQFRRKNLLGNVRFDFNFHRLLGTIAEKRKWITAEDVGIGAEKGKALEGVNFGFKFVPYVSFDFGGHVNNETVSKDEASVFVPRHRIFRSYAGFTGIIEWRVRDLPMSLNFDESFVHMATTEQIGYTTDDGVFLRRVHGLHPHFKTSLDLGFDPAKHYSLTFEYENGRLAPNFEYLNKFTTGIKVSY